MITRIPRLAALALLALSACGGAEESAETAAYDTTAAAPASAGEYAHPAPQFNTEEYAHIAENGFRDAAATPLSTFAIDVDVASYANVRRFIEQGQLPPADAVRIEELVNYFDYDDPPPAGPEPFRVNAEVAPAPWNPGHRLVRIGIQGRRMERDELPPSNLVFLVDVSGSMQDENKLPLVKHALARLVEEMRDEDHVSIAVYAGSAGQVLGPTPGRERRRILRAIDDLEAGGSTAGGEGILLAYELARQGFVRGGNNRVILATDGDFNVGVSSEGELVRLIERERQDGIALTVLGFGTGNYKDARMEALADHGNGNYAYVDGPDEAEKVLVREMGGTLFTIASDVKVQVEFNPAQVDSYRLIGYENRVMEDEDFNDDARDAGELGAGHHVTALYEVVPAGAGSDVRPRVDPLRYQARRAARSGGPDELFTVKLRYKEPGSAASRLIQHAVRDGGRGLDAASEDFRFAAAVAQWGMLLRRSPHAGGASFEDVLRLARGAVGHDPHGDRAGFVRLVRASGRFARAAGLERGGDEVEPWDEDDDPPPHEHGPDGVIEG